MSLIHRVLRLLSSSAQASTAVKSAKRAKLAVEPLEDRLVPTITFASYANGTFAYNDSSNAWRKITAALPKAMDEGADGTLFASFTSGTFRYNYWSNSWTKLTGATTTVLSAASDNTLVASYNSGTWEYGSTGWHKETVAIANCVAAAYDNYFFANFGSGNGSTQGLFRYNNGWTSLSGTFYGTGGGAPAMDASASGRLFVSGFRWVNRIRVHGTWMFVGNSDTQLTAAVASNIADIDGTHFYATFAGGTFEDTSSSTYTKLSSAIATQISVDDTSNFVGSFNSGTWEVIGGIWHKINTAQAILIA